MNCASHTARGGRVAVRRRIGSGLFALGATALTLVTLTAPAAASGQAAGARLTNADERRVAATGSIATQIQTLGTQQTAPFWIAIVQPAAKPRMQSCCYSGNVNQGGNDCCGSCRLEKQTDTSVSSAKSTTSPSGTASTPIKLEGSTDFVILARVADQRVERVRMFSPECALDAGGLRVYTITGVAPAASIAWLESLVRDDEKTPPKRREERMSGGAIAAIAMHGAPEADAALDRLVAAGRPRDQRRDAAFWLANTRGQHGFDVVRRLVRDETTDQDLRRHAVFCLTVTEHPKAVDELLDVAKNSPAPEVRSQALFWVANAAGKKAVGALTDAIENDPETQVKEKAVFALSQLPNREGTPLLIEVAKTNKNREIRKKAMFWLGQSKDPRALEFFETILR